MDDLLEIVGFWRAAPFPSGSTVESLDELHADLVLADSWVADGVIPYIERGVCEPARIDVLANLNALKDRLVDATRESDDQSKPLAIEYREYCELLKRVYETFAIHVARAK